jgi:hypothetical protein
MTDAAIPTPPAVKTVVYKPKNPAGLAQVLLVTLYVDLAVNALNFVADALGFQSVSRIDPDTPISSGGMIPGEGAISVLQGLGGLLQALVFIVCGFFCLKWIYRVSLNAHSLTSDMKITPAWGVGWFFVPFACLWKPFEGVRETWQVSAASGPGWKTQPTPPLLGWWWGFWIVANILGNIAFRLQMGATSIGETMNLERLFSGARHRQRPARRAVHPAGTQAHRPANGRVERARVRLGKPWKPNWTQTGGPSSSPPKRRRSSCSTPSRRRG